MFSIGDLVYLTTYTDSGDTAEVAGVITSTFYEPGDPVQGVSVRALDGTLHGGADSQDCRPRREA